MFIVIIIVALAGLSIAMSTKEQRDAASERMKPIGRVCGALTAALLITWYIRG